MACELGRPVLVPLRRGEVVFLIPYRVGRLTDPNQEIHGGQRDDKYRGGKDTEPFWQGNESSPFDGRL